MHTALLKPRALDDGATAVAQPSWRLHPQDPRGKVRSGTRAGGEG